MKVTRRERNLLLFLLFIATIALTFVFVILPLQSSIDARKILKVSLTDQKTLIDAQLQNGTGLDQKIDKALTDVNVEYDKIESPITSEEFELRIQPILISNDIRIASWVVNDPIVSHPKLPTYEDPGFVYKLKELIESYHGINSTTSNIPSTDTEMLLTNIVFTFTSSYTDYVELLDAIVGWDSTVFVSASSRDNVTGEAVISIDFYSIQKP
jgi:hypothetical protein